MPVSLRVRNNQLFVVSFLLSETNFTEPFFLDSLSRRFKIATVNESLVQEQQTLVRPLHYDKKDPRIVYTPLSEFIKKHRRQKKPNIENLRFIFHMSRCGSTLITQMLATSRRFFVISESPFINDILDPALKLPKKIDRDLLIKAALHAILDCKPKKAKYSVIKFRSWNTLYLERILKQFPTTSWVFVHRNGLEVLSSVLRNPPGWLRSRKNYEKLFRPFLELKNAEKIERLGVDEFTIRMLGTFCKIAASTKSGFGSFIDYKKILPYFPDTVERVWNLKLPTKEKSIMLKRAKTYSKDPDKLKKFVGDGKIKRRMVTERQRKLTSHFVETQRSRLIIKS